MIAEPSTARLTINPPFDMKEYEHLEESLEIDAPPGVIFQSLLRFEDFPRFMEGVSEVHRIDQNVLLFRHESAGQTREWLSEISVVIPGERLAWRTSSDGAQSSRVVSIKPVPGDKSRVTFKLLLDPNEIDALPPDAEAEAEAIPLRLARELTRFKAMVESKSSPQK
jgi:uncharacterized membrane protein